MRSTPVAIVGPLLGAIAGVTSVIFTTFVGANPAKMVALPMGVGLLGFLVLDPKKLLLTILALRSAGDLLLDSTRIAVGGHEIGVGGLLNAFVILVVALLVLEKPRLVPPRALAMWAGLLLAATVGVALSPVKVEAVRTSLGLISWFAVFTGAFYVVRSPADFRFCIRLVLWSSVIPVTYALVELVTGGGMRAEGVRLQGTFAHPNIFAFYLTAVIATTLYAIKCRAMAVPTPARVVATAYMLLLIGLLILTKTRSAWVACFFIFAIFGGFCERRYLLYLLAAPILALLMPGVQERLADLAAGNDYVQYARLNSFAWRRLLWETALGWMTPDHYVLGYGLDSFRQYSVTFFPLSNPADIGPGAHNVYVQLFFELGVLGLIAFFWLFGRLASWLRSLATTDRRGSVIASGLALAYLVASVSDNMFSYLSFNWYFWFLQGAACALALAKIPDPSGASAAHSATVAGTGGSQPAGTAVS